jgi:hypothetical protein
MIASLRGRLRRKLEDRIVVEAAGVGYEIFVPPVTPRIRSLSLRLIRLIHPCPIYRCPIHGLNL